MTETIDRVEISYVGNLIAGREYLVQNSIHLTRLGVTFCLSKENDATPLLPSQQPVSGNQGVELQSFEELN